MNNLDTDIFTTHTVLGHAIVDKAGEVIGSIEGVLPGGESSHGNIVIVALNSGSGVTDQVFGVAGAALKFDPETQRFVLDGYRNDIARARRADKRRWHEIPYEQWASESYGVALLDIITGGQSTQDYFTPER